ncbi:MAG: hypothetical protein V4729_13070 [Pseudomonadota bacterium]
MKTHPAILALPLLLHAAAALALNEGFETGNVEGFGGTIPPGAEAGVVTAHAGDTTTYAPVRGRYFLELKTNGPDRHTQFEQPYQLKAGEFLKGYAAFDARERGSSTEFNDYAQVRILSAERDEIALPWSADVASVGATGDGAWTTWTFTAPADGTYIVEYRIINAGDDAHDSYALFDGDEIDLDIKPGSDPNRIRPDGPGLTPAAILSPSDVPITHIDRSTLRFGDRGVETAAASLYRDLGGDGDVDILSVFRTRSAGWTCASGYGFVTARLYSGQYISGSDAIVTGCR